MRFGIYFVNPSYNAKTSQSKAYMLKLNALTLEMGTNSAYQMEEIDFPVETF